MPPRPLSATSRYPASGSPTRSRCRPRRRLGVADAGLRVPAGVLARTYGLERGARITVGGLVEMGSQFLSRGVGPLPGGAVLPAATAARIGERLGELNAELAALAGEHG